MARKLMSVTSAKVDSSDVATGLSRAPSSTARCGGGVVQFFRVKYLRRKVPFRKAESPFFFGDGLSVWCKDYPSDPKDIYLQGT